MRDCFGDLGDGLAGCGEQGRAARSSSYTGDGRVRGRVMMSDVSSLVRQADVGEVRAGCSVDAGWCRAEENVGGTDEGTGVFMVAKSSDWMG